MSRVVNFTVYDRVRGLIYGAKDFILESGNALWYGYNVSKKVNIGAYSYNLEVVLINGIKIDKISNVTELN